MSSPGTGRIPPLSGPTLRFGPAGWLSTSWTYDRIGNLLADPDRAASLTYVPNSSMSGYTSVLDEIHRGFADVHDYTFDAAGRQQAISSKAGGWTNLFEFDDESRLVQISKKGAAEPIDFTYDGRGFLSLGVRQVDGLEMRPLYSSEGVYQGVRRTPVGADEELEAVFYLGNRPVAQWRKVGAAPASLTYLTTDHLGTPILATTPSATPLWSGGFEPYGRDYANAHASNIRLRLPGQIDDPLWRESSFETPVHYNLHRWFETARGSYFSPDALGVLSDPNLFGYGRANPTFYFDPFGLWVAVPPGTHYRNPGNATVVCSQGRVIPDLGEFQSDLQRRCCWVCTWVHEASHIRDILRSDPNICRGVRDGWYVFASSNKELNDSERRAYAADIRCADKYLAELRRGSSVLQAECEDYVRRMREDALNILGSGRYD
jgi:RHS repeat-associated protein